MSIWGLLTRTTLPFSQLSPLSCSSLKPLARLFKTEALSRASEDTYVHSSIEEDDHIHVCHPCACSLRAKIKPFKANAKCPLVSSSALIVATLSGKYPWLCRGCQGHVWSPGYTGSLILIDLDQTHLILIFKLIFIIMCVQQENIVLSGTIGQRDGTDRHSSLMWKRFPFYNMISL